MSIFTKPSTPLRYHSKRVTLTQAFDRGDAIVLHDRAGNSPNHEPIHGEYDVPKNGWSEQDLHQAHSITLEGEYNVVAGDWADEDMANTLSAAQDDYEVPINGWPEDDQLSYSHSVDAERYRASVTDEAETLHMLPDQNGIAEQMRSQVDGNPEQASCQCQSQSQSSGQTATASQASNANKPNNNAANHKASINTEPAEEDNIDEAAMADDIRSIMMASSSPSTPLPADADLPIAQPAQEQPFAPAETAAPAENPFFPEAQPETQQAQKMANEHAIFDQIAQSMKYANAYDLGDIAIEQRFDSFDEAEDLQPAKPRSPAPSPTPMQQQPAATQSVIDAAQQQDFIEDLDLISAQSQTGKIPLDPGVGGRSIDQRAMEPGDIILSTTNEDISNLIRSATDSAVSHTGIYIGNGQIVEAIDTGTIVRSLDTALAGDSLAVAYRHRDMTEDKAQKVVSFLKQQAKSRKKFDNWGLVRAAPGQLARAICNRLDGSARKACLAGANAIKVGTDDNDAFFCSELVLAALKQAELGITDIDPSWSSPAQIVDLHLNGFLDYVGHLKV